MKNILVDLNHMLFDLIDQNSKWWDIDKFHSLFYPQDSKFILEIKLMTDEEDSFLWRYNHNGDYYMKSGYWLATKKVKIRAYSWSCMLPSTNQMKQHIWRIQDPNKIRIFLWKTLSDAISTATLYRKIGRSVDSSFQICGSEGKAVNHILFLCIVARKVWALSNVPHRQYDMLGSQSIKTCLISSKQWTPIKFTYWSEDLSHGSFGFYVKKKTKSVLSWMVDLIRLMKPLRRFLKTLDNGFRLKIFEMKKLKGVGSCLQRSKEMIVPF